MKWISTRKSSPPVSVSQAIDSGLAPDGGLYVPEFFPKTSTQDFSYESVLAPFFESDPLFQSLSEICSKAFNFEIPLRMIRQGKRSYGMLELFHGPTAAFKDVGARFLAECQSRIHQDPRTVLVATSGDTGGAVAAAFHRRPGFNVIILFPKGMVSARQQHQLTCWGENVKAFSVQGTFDDCQRMVKQAFQDTWWRTHFHLTSANSINVGRLLPQMTYYAKASLAYQKQTGQTPGMIIPSGNLGNAVAALWAKECGYPIHKVIMATNANRSVADYLSSGIWKAHPTIATLANAMDVGNPSNMERALHLYPSIEQFRKNVASVSVSDEEIRQSIVEGYRNGETWCPHTATGTFALNHLPSSESHPDWIVVATAHPAKFETIVEPLIGSSVPIPPSLQSILGKKSNFEEIPATLEGLKAKLV